MSNRVTAEISAYFRDRGRNGGKARAQSLSKKRLSAIAREAGIASGKARRADKRKREKALA